MTGQEKRKKIETLLLRLEGELEPTERLQALEELKVLGRSTENADPLYAEKGIQVLTAQGFDGDDLLARREAQRCLANALLLKPETREVFVQVGGLEKFVTHVKKSAGLDGADQFLLARIGFVLTAQKGDIVERLVREEHIIDPLVTVIQSYASLSGRELSSTELMAFTEVLKFLYNLTFHVKVQENIASPLVPPLVQLLRSYPTREFRPPLTNVVHVLLNLPLSQSHADVFPNNSTIRIVPCILDSIDRTIPEDTESIKDTSLDENLSPVFVLLNNIYETAPPAVKVFMKEHILPSESDRNLPLGESQSLPSRMLRLVTNAFTPTLRESIFSLMYQLVDSSATALIDAIGYGYASGFLFSHNIPIPPNLQNPQGGRSDVNPVTGQRLDAEPELDLSQMTDEEKEREAERLFVLFERLRGLGVGVENPVRTAQQTGRFEELDE